MAEGDFPKIDGDILFASEINSFAGQIQQVYTATGFDSTTASANPDTQDHELDAVTNINGAEFVKVKITGTISYNTGTANAANVQLKAQIKETSGAYGDIVAFKTIFSISGIRSGANVTTTYTYEIVATLTAGQKTNGFQIKVFSKSDKNSDASISFTNIQTVQELS